ncbi:MAG: hypothetical protein ACMUJM_02910 [bacterium]
MNCGVNSGCTMNMDIKKDIGFVHVIRQEISKKINIYVKSVILDEKEYSYTHERALADGMLIDDSVAHQCPICSEYFTRGFCWKCFHAKDDPKLKHSDHQRYEDRGVLSDNDSDDERPSEEKRQEKIKQYTKQVGFKEVLSDFIQGCQVDEKDVPVYTHLVSLMFLENKGADDELTNTVVENAVKSLNKKEAELRHIWENRPFNQADLDSVIEEAKAAVPPVLGNIDYERIICKIEKYGNKYQALIIDPYEKVIENSARKRRVIITTDGVRINAGIFLKKKREVKENLQKILVEVIEKRINFFEAEDRRKALEILRYEPLPQIEVAEQTGLGKWTVSRHAARYEVKTSHGEFILGDFFKEKSRVCGKTHEATMKKVEDIILEGDKQGVWPSDQKIVELMKKNFNCKISERNVTKVRNKLDYPTFGLRRELFYSHIVESIIEAFERGGKQWKNQNIKDIINKEGIEISSGEVRDAIKVIEEKRKVREVLTKAKREEKLPSNKEIVAYLKKNGLETTTTRVNTFRKELE